MRGKLTLFAAILLLAYSCTRTERTEYVTEEDIIFVRWDVCTCLTQDVNLCDSLYNPKKLNFN